LTCNEPLGELLVAVEDAARGEAHCSPRVAAALLHRVRMLGQTAPVVPQAEAVANRLTSRELQIVALIAQGLSNKEIATRLMIELPTVKNHVHNILSKLGVKQRADAVRRVWSARAVAVGTLALLVSI
jgi:DNA-binding NarL/FixJ family response regulator